MVNPHKAFIVFILLMLKLVAYGQSNKTFRAEISTGSIKKLNSIAVNDIPTTTTDLPNISYSTPQIFGINAPIAHLSPVNNDSPCISGFPATSNSIEVDLITPVTPSVNITASADYVFPGTKVKFTARINTGSTGTIYQWYVNNIAVGYNSPEFESNDLINGDLVKCIIAPANSCSIPVESSTLKVNIVTRVEIPNTFTPNADGINDTWFIKGLASYPNCVVSIYTRHGQLLYQSRGYGTDWDGKVNGNNVPPATYYYIIDLRFQNKLISGYVTVVK